MTRPSDGTPRLPLTSDSVQAADRGIREGRVGLATALAEVRGALRERTGLRVASGWTGPLLAAGVGLAAALAIRRYLRR